VSAASDIRSERGQTAVEVAIVLPLLVMILMAIIQFGIALNNYETVTDAARVGARSAILVRTGGSTVAQATQNARNAASGLDQTKLVVTVTAPNWAVAGTEVTVTATYPYAIDLLGFVVASGNLSSTTKERLE
jgi:Flp pilus assembly protein TadG